MRLCMEPPCNLEKLILADGASEIRMPAISHKKQTNIIFLAFNILLPQPYFHFLAVGFCICVLAY